MSVSTKLLEALAAGRGLSLEPEDLKRPLIQVNGRFLREVVADTVAALQKANEPPTMFVRGSELVRVPEDSAHAEPLTVAALRVLMDQAADFAKIKDTEDGEEIRPARPPRDVAESILAIPPRDTFPKLAGIRSQPVFLPDGRLVARDGYDPESGLLMRLRGLDGVRDDMPADEALRWLFDELLVDFPFEDEAGRAHALALLLEPFVRPLIDGPTPLYLIDAPVRGTGKGLLSAVCCLIATGQRPDVMTLVRSDPEEHEKRITALLLAGAQWILLDNVETLKRAVEIGIGISILPRASVRTEVAAGTLVEVEIADGVSTRPIAILLRRGRTLSKATEAVLQVFLENDPKRLALAREATS